MNDKAAAVALVAAATDALVVGWVLTRGRGPIGGRRSAQAALAGAALVAAQVAGGLLAVRSFFLALTIAWAFLALALPAVALLLLARRALRERATPAVRALAMLVLATVPLSVYASCVEPYRLVTERAEIAIAPERALTRPITIAVLADIQCVEVGEREHEAVRRALDARPDLVLLPGDFAQVGSHRIPEIAPAFRALLAPLDAPLGVFCVLGDTDTRADLLALVEGTRVRLLEDQVLELGSDGQRLTLCGVGLRYDSISARAALRDVESRPGTEGVRLVLAHRPDAVYGLSPGSRVDLVVAGHTHGGQVALPFVGPPIVLSRVPRRVGAGGLHDLEGRRLYVSRGIGWEHGHAPRLRFLAPPEVSILTLR
ncbi:MAG: metallophosphoesterase [Planctomycetes bacterium]|nr:metallophosphoesterase [Planctomycetota bacterium]